MNLDELKKQLNQKLEETNHTVKSVVELQHILHTKSTSIIQKIKRSVIFEIISTTVFFVAFCCVAFFSKQNGIAIYFGSFALLCIPFAFVLFYLLKRINTHLNSSLDIKTNLVKLHNLIKDFCKRYFQFTIALIPIAFIFSIYIGLDLTDDEHKFNASMNSTSINKNMYYGFLAGYLISVGLGIYFFTKWYLKKLYGNYLIELEALIKEL
jgi:hypothetical protein